MENNINKLVTVNISQDMIDKGIAGHCGLCPLALGFGAVVKENIKIRVGLIGVTLKDYWKELPTEATDFRYYFDDGIEVYPFSFEIELPIDLLK